jgi:hypothetical protein
MSFDKTLYVGGAKAYTGPTTTPPKKGDEKMIYMRGMKVQFGRPNGEKTIGEIVKVNGKSLKIKQTEIRGTQKTHKIGTVWTVPKNTKFVTIIS